LAFAIHLLEEHEVMLLASFELQQAIWAQHSGWPFTCCASRIVIARLLAHLE